jgi:succinyl-CoA:acetate CoA-transferase
MGTLSAATSRILNSKLERKIMSAATAAGLIQTGDQIGMSGFTGSGYPKGGAD